MIEGKIANLYTNSNNEILFPRTTASAISDSKGNNLQNILDNLQNALDNLNTPIDMNKIYPIGSIYMSVNDISPASLFGGEWERIKGRFLLGADETYVAGEMKGEAEHTLTIDEMPSHKHNIRACETGNGLYGFADRKVTGENEKYRDLDYMEEVGGNQPHNNMPPYLAVYMWKRIS